MASVRLGRPTSTDVYELALFVPPSTPGVFYYEVSRVNTGDVASGVAVVLDVMSDYIETDN